MTPKVAHLAVTTSEAPHSVPPSSAALALANFALLVAEGSSVRYVEVLNNLYMDNGLKIPDFSRYVPLQPEQEELSFTTAEEDVSSMADLDEYCNTGSQKTAFTEDYNALFSLETRNLEDWFDNECDVLDEPEIYNQDNSCDMKSSTPMLCHQNRFSSDMRSTLLGRHNNLLFDLTVDNFPDQLLDHAIHQAETLNETGWFPRLNFDVTSSDNDDTAQQQQSIDELESLINNNVTRSPGVLTTSVIDHKCHQSPHTPQRRRPRSDIMCKKPLSMDYLDLTPRPLLRPAARCCRSPTTVNAAGTDGGHTNDLGITPPQSPSPGPPQTSFSSPNSPDQLINIHIDGCSRQYICELSPIKELF